MSRRDRISDFTRPVAGNRISDSRHVVTTEMRSRLAPVANKDSRKAVRRTDRPATVNPVQPRQTKSTVLRRQGLNKLPEFKPIKRKRTNYIQDHKKVTAVIAGILIMPFAVFLILSHSSDIKQVQSKVFSNDMPKYLTSSSIMDVAVKVTPIDSFDNDKREVTEPNHVGWYNESSKPGKPGVVVIVGDVRTGNEVSPLYNVHAMKKGDSIQLETGDGQLLIYKVVEVRKYDPAKISKEDIMKPAVHGQSGLNILTYTDSTNPSSELGKNRYIVYAQQE